MAFQLAAKRLLSRHLSVAVARTFSSTAAAAPSVFDKLISLTIVDPSGARRKIPGLVGEYVVCGIPIGVSFEAPSLVVSKFFFTHWLLLLLLVVSFYIYPFLVDYL
jgi:hypothetical protein